MISNLLTMACRNMEKVYQTNMRRKSKKVKLMKSFGFSGQTGA